MARLRLGRKALWAVTPTKPDTSDGPNYKPVFLKLPFLVFFALYVATLLAVLEYVCRVFPTSLERQDIPESDGPTDPIPSAFLTKPFIGARGTQTASMLPARTPEPRLSKRTPRRWAGKRSENTTSTTNSTSIAAQIFADLDPNDSAARALLPPPAQFAGREAYGPGYLALLQGLELGNSSLGNNGSESHVSSLRKRYQDRSRYGKLSGPIVGINYFVMLEPDFVISRVTYERESAGRLFSEICEPVGDTGFSQGLVTCDGPAMIFHDEQCFNNWRELSAMQRQRRAAGDRWEIIEMIEDKYGTAEFPGDEPVICAARGQKAITKTGVGLEGSGGADPGSVIDPEEETAPSEITQIVRGPDGVPTATLTAVIDYSRGGGGTLVPVSTRIREIPGFTPTDKPYTTVLTNYKGFPTATVTTFGPGAATTIVLYNEGGTPTGTMVAGVPPPKFTMVQTDADGRVRTTAYDPLNPSRPAKIQPTATPPWLQPAGANEMFHSLTPAEYFLILFLPVTVGTICSILSEMVYSELRALLPFHSLIQPGGATVGFSLVMATGGISGVVNSFRLLFQFRDPLAFMTDVLVFSSASITTLLSEAVGIQLQGACTAQSFSGCFMGIGAFLGPSRAVQALLALNLAILFALCFLLHRWRSGVSMAPRSIAATAALIQDSNLRQLFLSLVAAGENGESISQKEIAEHLRRDQFFLRPFYDPKQSAEDYGIITRMRPGPLSRSKTGLERLKTGFSKLTRSSSNSSLTGKTKKFRDWLFYQGARTNRLVDFIGLLYLCGLLILITYYNSVMGPNVGFEAFMNDQNFGVRVLFTAFGVALTFFWDHYYARAAMSEPYRQLWLHPQSAKKSIMVSPPTSVFTGGFVGSLKRGEIWMSIVGFTNILSKITPMLLSNIPFSPIQTWEMHLVCAWSTVSCLAFMIVVILCGVFFIKHPPLPVDPGSLAGRIYYLCDSQVADEFQGMSRMNKAECETKVDMEKWYRFGKMIGVSGELRVGVDTAHPRG